MSVSALIMAGGKGSRFDFDELGLSHHEKPLLEINNKPIIKLIIEELEKAESIERIIVAVSPFTPNTEAFLRTLSYNIEVILTPGDGYHQDIKHVVKELNLKQTITITADTPLITAGFFEQIVKHYIKLKKPALSVMSPKELFVEAGLFVPSLANYVDDDDLVPIGINIIDGSFIDLPYIDQAIFLNKEKNFLYNINTIEDYLKLKEFLSKRNE